MCINSVYSDRFRLIIHSAEMPVQIAVHQASQAAEADLIRESDLIGYFISGHSDTDLSSIVLAHLVLRSLMLIEFANIHDLPYELHMSSGIESDMMDLPSLYMELAVSLISLKTHNVIIELF